MGIEFAKMHGLGNDFMVLDLVSNHISFTPEDVRRWADRHTGIGFDQLLTVEPPGDPETDFRYRIYNADGTEAEQCGNGARCVARLIAESGLSIKPVLRLQTSNGVIETRLLDAATVEVDMGVPGMSPAAVPFDPRAALAQDGPGYQLCSANAADGARHSLIPISMGNPHGVIFVEEIASTAVAEIGEQLTAHPFFPEKANIGFCQVVDGGFVRLRVYERGVGETRACGTGACAAVVAGRLTQRLAERVKVSLPGGKVRVNWPGTGATVKMTGPASLVYHGQLPDA